MKPIDTVLVDLSHTSHSAAQTGIQRHARSLFAELAALVKATPVCFDPYLDSWRELDTAELECVHRQSPRAGGRSARWSASQKLRGWSQRFLGRTPALPAAAGLVVPEIFSPLAAARQPQLFDRVSGPRVAFCFDTIPLTHPEFTPPKTVARFPALLQELLRFDGVAAISQTTAASLRGYWRWLGIRDTPAVQVIPLGAVRPPKIAAAALSGAPRVLCVSSIEGRKNHAALLAAAETLWAEGLEFQLHLVGLPRPETAEAALREIDALRGKGRPLHFAGALDEPALEAAWAASAFSVYPSEIEGFGLPVIESLVRDKPCICFAGGATGEIATGGGCVGVSPANPANLAAAIRQLLTEPQRREQLAAAARTRAIPTWADTARKLLAWMNELRRRT